MAGLIRDLCAEEDALSLGGGRPHDRAQLVGDLLLADEEAGEPVHPLEALFLGDALVPVDPVLREVEVLGRPLLALPEVVELGVVEELDRAPIGALQGRIGGRPEVLAPRPRPSLFLCLDWLHRNLLSSRPCRSLANWLAGQFYEPFLLRCCLRKPVVR